MMWLKVNHVSKGATALFEPIYHDLQCLQMYKDTYPVLRPAQYIYPCKTLHLCNRFAAGIYSASHCDIMHHAPLMRKGGI